MSKHNHYLTYFPSIFLLGAIGSLLVHPGKCFAKTINVPGDYAAIQWAIDAAQTGDTIKVAAGKYRENIRMRNNIDIIGAGAGKSKIKPATDTSKKPIVVTADKCLFEGFTILSATKGAPAAILVDNTSPTISNNAIKRNYTFGILVKGKGAKPVIEHNRIYKNQKAGIMVSSSGGWITANELFENFGQGINLMSGYTVIEENYIYKNQDTGITAGPSEDGKRSENSQEPFIHNNRIEYNKTAGVATENSSPSIIGNTISNKGKPAILLFSSNSVIKNNLLISNGPPAIRINSTSSPIVEDNVINSTLRFPIMNDSRTARIRSNVVNSKWAPGIPGR